MYEITRNRLVIECHGVKITTGLMGGDFAVELEGAGTSLHNNWLARHGFSPINTDKYIARRTGDTPFTYQELVELAELSTATGIQIHKEPITPRVNQQNIYDGTNIIGIVYDDWEGKTKAMTLPCVTERIFDTRDLAIAWVVDHHSEGNK